MNRFYSIAALAILVGAALLGWLGTGAQARLDAALVLADVTTPGCDGAGQLHLTLGNGADEELVRVAGVLSFAETREAQPVPIGNFELSGPFAPGEKVDFCVSIDDARLEGRDRRTVLWLARATSAEFGSSR